MSGFLTNTWYGTVVAMRDRCPHRLAPLSGGTVTDDVLQCTELIARERAATAELLEIAAD